MKNIEQCEGLSIKDGAEFTKKGLRGHVQIFRENKVTGEESLWYEDDNVISISGYQFILMKIFGLYLDSVHDPSDPYENLSKDTNVIVPDLNSDAPNMKLGISPQQYSVMAGNISENHFIQGFMIGTQGAAEDAITTKNTDYSFINLRNPIPFQQATSGDVVSGKYLGIMRRNSSSEEGVNSYYIKKFDSTPHIYHSWWKDNQNWDYVDPVTQNDLGPNAANGLGKTSRIETYVQCEMSLEDNDCVSYFERQGTQSAAAVNELGLVAYDAVYGSRSLAEALYSNKIDKFINLVCMKDTDRTNEQVLEAISLAQEIVEGMTILALTGKGQSNIDTFYNIVQMAASATSETINFANIRAGLESDECISVDPLYDHDQTFRYQTNKFMEYLSSDSYNDLTNDEAERIKLVTYYTFNSIPLEENWKIKIKYRIYAN